MKNISELQGIDNDYFVPISYKKSLRRTKYSLKAFIFLLNRQGKHLKLKQFDKKCLKKNSLLLFHFLFV